MITKPSTSRHALTLRSKGLTTKFEGHSYEVCRVGMHVDLTAVTQRRAVHMQQLTLVCNT